MMTEVTDDLEPAPLRVVPADTAPFADIEAVFGTKGDPAHCWCQWYKIPGSDWRGIGDEALRERLQAQLHSPGAGPGLLAYDGDVPVGWCAVEPRANLPRLKQSRLIADHTPNPDLDEPGIWSISCFVVPRAHRRRGVARALAEAAVEFARANGGRIVEGYAVDPTKHAKIPAADLFHGTVSMFVDAGFTEMVRPNADRAIMQLQLRE